MCVFSDSRSLSFVFKVCPAYSVKYLFFSFDFPFSIMNCMGSVKMRYIISGVRWGVLSNELRETVWCNQQCQFTLLSHCIARLPMHILLSSQPHTFRLCLKSHYFILSTHINKYIFTCDLSTAAGWSWELLVRVLIMNSLISLQCTPLWVEFGKFKFLGNLIPIPHILEICNLWKKCIYCL